MSPKKVVAYLKEESEIIERCGHTAEELKHFGESRAYDEIEHPHGLVNEEELEPITMIARKETTEEGPLA